MTREDLAAELLDEFERRHISFVVTGDVRDPTRWAHGDIDIVVEPGDLERAWKLVPRFLTRKGVRLIQVLRYEHNARYHVAAWRGSNAKLFFLRPDVCGDYYRNGWRVLRASELLEGRVRAGSIFGDCRRFYVPAPPQAFVYYLAKRIDKADLGTRNQTYLNYQWQQDPGGACSETHRLWPGPEADMLCRVAASGDWERVTTQIHRFRRSIRGRPLWGRRISWAEICRGIDRLCRPTGFWIAVLGPDGVGKSTVLERIEQSMAFAFRRTQRYHLRPSLGRNKAEKAPVTDPHSVSPRGRVASLLKLLYWWCDYLLGFFLNVYPRLARSSFVLFDRYYHDILVDPKRYRHRGFKRLAQRIANSVPIPDRVIILDAPVDRVQSRKAEVSWEETRRQRNHYRALAEQMGRSVLVDASRPVDEVVQDVEDLLLRDLERRTASRFEFETVDRI